MIQYTNLDLSTPICYTFQLEDYDKLIQICNRIYLENNADFPSIKNNFWKKKFVDNINNEDLIFFRQIMVNNGFIVKDDYLTKYLNQRRFQSVWIELFVVRYQ